MIVAIVAVSYRTQQKYILIRAADYGRNVLDYVREVLECQAQQKIPDEADREELEDVDQFPYDPAMVSPTLQLRFALQTMTCQYSSLPISVNSLRRNWTKGD
jgi:hypothetical protein